MNWVAYDGICTFILASPLPRPLFNLTSVFSSIKWANNLSLFVCPVVENVKLDMEKFCQNLKVLK